MIATTLPFSMSHFPTTCLLQLSHWHLPSLLCDKLGCKPMFLLAIVCFATAMPHSLVLIDNNKWGIIIPIKVEKNPLFSSMMSLAIASSAFLHWDHLEERTYWSLLDMCDAIPAMAHFSMMLTCWWNLAQCYCLSSTGKFCSHTASWR